jgi:4,5-DOPA dioxygenase extradiol
MTTVAPAFFVSHGLPPLALMDDPYNSALINFGRNLNIKGVICVSSQWLAPGPIQITSNPNPFIQYNFHGYQKDLYDLKYSTPFSNDLLTRVSLALSKESFEFILNPHYGFDHGVWMPIRLIRPDGDLPVVQLSLPFQEDPRKIMALGHALSKLREEGILILGSGLSAFNASKIIWHARGEDVNPKIKEFDQWLEKKILSAEIEDLIDYRKSGPNGEFAHPSSATLLPLFFIIGSAITGDRPQIIFRGFKYSSVSLLSFSLSSYSIVEKTMN